MAIHTLVSIFGSKQTFHTKLAQHTIKQIFVADEKSEQTFKICNTACH